MSTSPQDPRDPAEEPDRDGSGAGPAGSAGAARDEDALWAGIVANYGDRALLDDSDPPDARATSGPPPGPAAGAGRDGSAGRDDDPFPRPEEPDDDGDLVDRHDVSDHFVPPTPPPVPRTTPVRTLAWLGLFGVPALVLVALVAQLSLPGWVGLLLMGWFVGGFVYLVASMRSGDDRDGWDDGAVV